jgi:hypothetical protein
MFNDCHGLITDGVRIWRWNRGSERINEIADLTSQLPGGEM